MKKKVLSSLAFILAFTPLFSVSAETTVKSNLKEVTVFLQGAQLHRTAEATITAGISDVVITGLPAYLDLNSIQVKGKGNFMILSVNHRRNHLTDAKTSELVKMLQDSLEYYKSRIDFLNAMQSVYKEEESLILSNKNIGGKESGLKVSELKAAADFMRERLSEIKVLSLENTAELTRLNQRHNRIRNQLNIHQPTQTKVVGEVVVTVSAPRSTKAELELSYLFMGAGWSPVYDLRSKSVADPFELNLKANVHQSTGEDWNNVMLTLSTGDPSRGGQIQYLNPWRLAFLQPPPPSVPRHSAAPAMLEMADEEIVVYGYGTAPRAGAVADVTTVAQAQTTFQYNINTPVNISGDNTRRLIDIQNYSVPATYEYYAVPKLDTDAFLIAKVTDWEEYILIPGVANLFFEDTYIGQSAIDPYGASDTLELSLGRDKNISINREKKKEFTSRSFLGSRQIENIAWELDIRNNKREKIKLTIMDQIPVSTHRDIDVRLEEKSGAELEEDTGMLKWTFDLAPSAGKKLEFRYVVRYPKDKKLILE